LTPDLAIEGIAIICLFLLALSLGVIFYMGVEYTVVIIEGIGDWFAAIGNWVAGKMEGE